MAKRKRAPRGGLSPAKIIESALEIADGDGLEALTVRRLAGVMGVSPMAIYGHFANKSQIVSALLGRVIEAFEVTEHDALEGRAWIVESFERMRRALLNHPGVTPLLGTQSSISAQSVGVMEAIVSKLVELGCPEKVAAESFYAMMTFTIGSAHVAYGVRQAMAAGAMNEDSSLYDGLNLEAGQTLLRMAPSIVEQGSEENFVKVLERLCPEL